MKTTIDKICAEKHTTLEDEFYDFDESADKVAKERGCTVVYPEANQLQFDIDSEEQLADFTRRMEVFEGYIEYYNLTLREVSRTASMSGNGHYHITLDLRTAIGGEYMPYVMTEWQRIAMQSVLGSDPLREFLNASRLITGTEKPTRLFEKIEKKPPVTRCWKEFPEGVCYLALGHDGPCSPVPF